MKIRRTTGRIGLALAITALLAACGKTRVDALQEHPEMRWDEPSTANGFHPAGPVACPKPQATKAIPSTPNGTLEDVAGTKTYAGSASAVAADNAYIYWIDGVGESNASVFRAERSAPWGMGTWDATSLVTGESYPREVAVTDHILYWTIRPHYPLHRGAKIRAWNLAMHELATVADVMDDEKTPTRLLAAGSSVFWVDTPNTIRELSDNGKARDFTAATSLDRSMLAADTEALFALNEQALFRIPRNGAPPTVLLSNLNLKPNVREVADLAVEGAFVYWLERGSPTNEECEPRCLGCNYGPKTITPHPDGSLHRVPVHGGAEETLATGLPDVTHLTFLRGVAFISTETALLRINPSDHPVRPTFIDEGMGANGRAAVLGDALVLGLHKRPTRIALLSRP